MTENPEKNEMMFIQLIAIFQAAALQHMGKLKNPASEKIEKDMGQAQLSIDILDMLKVKTKGNLSAEEERYLGLMLQDLKLNYVDELAKETPRTSTTEEGSQ